MELLLFAEKEKWNIPFKADRLKVSRRLRRITQILHLKMIDNLRDSRDQREPNSQRGIGWSFQKKASPTCFTYASYQKPLIQFQNIGAIGQYHYFQALFKLIEMNWIVAKKKLSGCAAQITITSPEVAQNAKPGQYVNIKLTENSETRPYTVLETNKEKGSVMVLATKRFANYADFSQLNTGDEIFSIEGPLGTSYETNNVGTVICIAEGSGIEPLYAVVKELRKAGNKVITILASHTELEECLREEFQQLSALLFTVTCNRELGLNSGIVSGMEKAIQTEKVNKIISFGNAFTAKEVCVFAHFRHQIPANSYLYTVGNTHCPYEGIFRISLTEKSDLVCVDGDNFNAYYQGFDKMIKRFECHQNAKTSNNMVKETLRANN